MGKRTALTDIAQAVGVTPSTVQRTLSDTPGAGEEKRQEIKRVARQMGYQGNTMAKMLQKQGLTVAVILPEKVLLTGDFSISDQYADIQGFEQVLMQNGSVFEIIKLSGRGSAAPLSPAWRNMAKIFSAPVNIVTLY